MCSNVGGERLFSARITQRAWRKKSGSWILLVKRCQILHEILYRLVEHNDHDCSDAFVTNLLSTPMVKEFIFFWSAFGDVTDKSMVVPFCLTVVDK